MKHLEHCLALRVESVCFIIWVWVLQSPPVVQYVLLYGILWPLNYFWVSIHNLTGVALSSSLPLSSDVTLDRLFYYSDNWDFFKPNTWCRVGEEKLTKYLFDPKRSWNGAHRCHEQIPWLDRWPLSQVAPGCIVAPQPCWFSPKQGCTHHSSLLTTKFQGAQTLVRALPTDVPETAWSPDSEAPLPLVIWGS